MLCKTSYVKCHYGGDDGDYDGVVEFDDDDAKDVGNYGCIIRVMAVMVLVPMAMVMVVLRLMMIA